MPVLSLTCGEREKVLAAWDAPAEGGMTLSRPQVTVNETGRYAFSLTPVRPKTEYRLFIGDQNIGEEGESDDMLLSRMIRVDQRLIWVEYMYFESARGWTAIHLEERTGDETDWRRVGSYRVYTLPTKLGEERYQAMVEDLRALCGGLLIDILGKSNRNIDRFTLNKGISFRSKEMELREVEEVWNHMGQVLELLARSPGTRPALNMEWAPYWGDKTLSCFELRQLANRGVNPKQVNIARPIVLRRRRFRDTTDIPEHRLLAGFAQMLQHRLVRCMKAIDDHRLAIEADKPYRNRTFGDRPSLYEQIDQPQLRQLEEARIRAAKLFADIYQALHSPPLADIPRELGLPRRENFGQNDLYRKARMLMEKFLRSSSFWTGDDPGDAMAKLSSRMYEQWVFISLVDAFRKLGLAFTGWEEVLRESGKRKFVIDFERGLGFTAHLTGRKYIRIRYEPWILPKRAALLNNETLFHGGKFPVPWCPDVLMECLLEKSAGRFFTLYGVAVDCKYAPKINAHHWERTRKYRYIRSCSNNSQVVRQLWLANPDFGERITIFDPFIQFNDNGLSCAPNDTFEGILPAIPGQSPVDENPIRNFASGILRFFTKLDVTG